MGRPPLRVSNTETCLLVLLHLSYGDNANVISDVYGSGAIGMGHGHIYDMGTQFGNYRYNAKQR
jgi:hypothetical protein